MTIQGRVTMPATELLASIPDAAAGIMITDPPWKLGGGGRFKAVADYDLLPAQEVVTVMHDARRALAPGAHFYCFAPAGPDFLGIANSFVADGWELLRILAWGKGSGAGLGAWRNGWEPILVFSNGTSRGFVGERCKHSSLLQEPPPHGRTAKPWQVYAKILEVSSTVADLAVDPFCGTNPLGKACARMGRGQPWLAGDVLAAEVVADSVKNRQWRRSGKIGEWGTYGRATSDAKQGRLMEGP